MKNISIKFTVIMAFIAIFCGVSFSQIVKSEASKINNDNNIFTFKVMVDSLNTYTTSAFTLSHFDAESFVTYPLSYGKLLSSTGLPKVSVYIDGSYGFATWGVVDTIMTTDSIKTYKIGTLDLNNNHCPWYRLRVVGTTGNRRNTNLDIVLYAPKKTY